jgi:hypothetical protein
MTTALILSLRDHSPDAVPSEPLAKPFITVPLVSSNPLGTCPRTSKRWWETHGIEDGLKLGRVVTLARGDMHGERAPPAIGHQRDFAAIAAARAA